MPYQTRLGKMGWRRIRLVAGYSRPCHILLRWKKNHARMGCEQGVKKKEKWAERERVGLERGLFKKGPHISYDFDFNYSKQYTEIIRSI
jgi:hypothetical protein